MTVYKTYCDHCGKELNDMTDYPDVAIGFVKFSKADFCKMCLDELETIISEFVEKGGEGK